MEKELRTLHSEVAKLPGEDLGEQAGEPSGGEQAGEPSGGSSPLSVITTSTATQYLGELSGGSSPLSVITSSPTTPPVIKSEPDSSE
jgi:hypothetical protein